MALLALPASLRAADDDDEEIYVTRGYCGARVASAFVEPVPVLLAELGLAHLRPEELPAYPVAADFTLAGGDSAFLADIIPNIANAGSVLVLKPEDHPLVQYLQMLRISSRGTPGTRSDSSWDGALSDNAEAEYDGNVRRYGNWIAAGQMMVGNQGTLAGYEAVVSHRLLQRLPRADQISMIKGSFAAARVGGAVIHTFPATRELGGTAKIEETYLAVRDLVTEALGNSGYDLAVFVGSTSLQRGQWNDNRLMKKLDREGQISGIGTDVLRAAYDRLTATRSPSMVRIELVKREAIPTAATEAPVTPSTWSIFNPLSWF